METKRLTDTPADLQKAAKLLRSGELVAIPTETVYGLAANALDGGAVRRIFAAKGRPQDNPLIVHIADMEELPPLVAEVPELAEKLAKAYWPTADYDFSQIGADSGRSERGAFHRGGADALPSAGPGGDSGGGGAACRALR